MAIQLSEGKTDLLKIGLVISCGRWFFWDISQIFFSLSAARWRSTIKKPNWAVLEASLGGSDRCFWGAGRSRSGRGLRWINNSIFKYIFCHIPIKPICFAKAKADIFSTNTRGNTYTHRHPQSQQNTLACFMFHEVKCFILPREQTYIVLQPARVEAYSQQSWGYRQDIIHQWCLKIVNVSSPTMSTSRPPKVGSEFRNGHVPNAWGHVRAQNNMCFRFSSKWPCWSFFGAHLVLQRLRWYLYG